MVYFSIFFVLILLCILNIVKNDNRELQFATIPMALALILMAGLRFETGADYGSYKAIYDITANEFKPTYGEPLFAILNYLIGATVNSFNALFFVIALFSVTIKFYCFKRYSKYMFVSIILYFVTNYLSQDFGQIRQGFAIAICFLSLKYLYEGEKRLFYVLVVFATLFHFSAVIFLLALYTDKFKFSWAKMLVIWSICFLLSTMLSVLSSYVVLLDIASKGNVLGDKLGYIGDDTYGVKVPINLGMFFKMMILYLATTFRDKFGQDDKYISRFINLYFIGGCVYFLFSFAEIYAGRLSVYFIFFELILIPYIIYCCKETVFKLLFFGVFLLYASYLLYQQLYVIKGNFLLPYKYIIGF